MERIEYELGKKDLYDYAVVNDELETAYDDVLAIINQEKNKI